MPILKVQIIQEEMQFRRGLAQSIADAAAEIFKSKPQGTWVTLEALPGDNYAENGGTSALPIFVEITLGQWPGHETMKRQARDLAASIAKACMRQTENVHIVFAPPAKGRIAFGGELT